MTFFICICLILGLLPPQVPGQSSRTATIHWLFQIIRKEIPRAAHFVSGKTEVQKTNFYWIDLTRSCCLAAPWGRPLMKSKLRFEMFWWPVSEARCYFHKLIGGWCKLNSLILKEAFQIHHQASVKLHILCVYSAAVIKLSDHTWMSACAHVCLCVCVTCDMFHLAPVSSVSGWVLPLNNGCYIITVWPCTPDLRSSVPFPSCFFCLPHLP